MHTATNNNHDAMIIQIRQTLQSLNTKKQSLELEGDAITEELTSGPNPMGIDTPLVDKDGYPRADIDLFRARTLRGRLNHIKTDHKVIMKQLDDQLQQLASLTNSNNNEQQQKEIEERLRPKPKPVFDKVTQKWVVKNWDGTISGAGGAIHGDGIRSFDDIKSGMVLASSSSVPGTVASTTTPTNMNITTTNDNNIENSNNNNGSINNRVIIHHPVPDEIRQQVIPINPFARVNSVADTSPANIAGLNTNDNIIAFGPISAVSKSLDQLFPAVSELVQRAATCNEIIEIQVQRTTTANDTTTTSIVFLQLQPKPWNGRGFLGCHIVPV